MDFSIPPEVVRVADGWHSGRLACLRTTRMPATRTASKMLRTKQETNLCQQSIYIDFQNSKFERLMNVHKVLIDEP